MHREFAVHMLNDEGKQKAKEIAEAYDELLTRLEKLCGDAPYIADGREFRIAVTKLEESCFFAKKAMAVMPKNTCSHRWNSYPGYRRCANCGTEKLDPEPSGEQ